MYGPFQASERVKPLDLILLCLFEKRKSELLSYTQYFLKEKRENRPSQFESSSCVLKAGCSFSSYVMRKSIGENCNLTKNFSSALENIVTETSIKESSYKYS